MLPAFIIDHIRQREEEEQAKHRQRQQELPMPRREEVRDTELEEESDRGIVIIDLLGE